MNVKTPVMLAIIIAACVATVLATIYTLFVICCVKTKYPHAYSIDFSHREFKYGAITIGLVFAALIVGGAVTVYTSVYEIENILHYPTVLIADVSSIEGCAQKDDVIDDLKNYDTYTRLWDKELEIGAIVTYTAVLLIPLIVFFIRIACSTPKASLAFVTPILATIFIFAFAFLAGTSYACDTYMDSDEFDEDKLFLFSRGDPPDMNGPQTIEILKLGKPIFDFCNTAFENMQTAHGHFVPGALRSEWNNLYDHTCGYFVGIHAATAGLSFLLCVALTVYALKHAA